MKRCNVLRSSSFFWFIHVIVLHLLVFFKRMPFLNYCQKLTVLFGNSSCNFQRLNISKKPLFCASCSGKFGTGLYGVRAWFDSLEVLLEQLSSFLGHLSSPLLSFENIFSTVPQWFSRKLRETTIKLSSQAGASLFIALSILSWKVVRKFVNAWKFSLNVKWPVKFLTIPKLRCLFGSYDKCLSS